MYGRVEGCITLCTFQLEHRYSTDGSAVGREGFGFLESSRVFCSHFSVHSHTVPREAVRCVQGIK